MSEKTGAIPSGASKHDERKPRNLRDRLGLLRGDRIALLFAEGMKDHRERIDELEERIMALEEEVFED